MAINKLIVFFACSGNNDAYIKASVAPAEYPTYVILSAPVNFLIKRNDAGIS